MAGALTDAGMGGVGSCATLAERPGLLDAVLSVALYLVRLPASPTEVTAGTGVIEGWWRSACG